MDKVKAQGGLEASTKAVDPTIEDSNAEISKESSTNHVIDIPTASILQDSENTSDEPAGLPPAQRIEDVAVDKAEALKTELEDSAIDDIKESSQDPGKQLGTVADKVDEPVKNGDSTSTQSTSDRVRDGQNWNKRDFRKNVKSDLTSQEESSDPVAIRKQVEFYFSNSNLLQDQFLYSKVEGHMNLPVPISIIASFKRMRHFKPRSAIVAALKESEVLNVVENDSCVQRKEALPEDFQDKAMNEIVQVHEDEAMSRSVYAKGFGEEEPSTQFDIEAYFAAYGPTNSVRLRRTFDRKFKGSVFVEFDSEETQHSFLAVDPKPKWKGSDLLIKSKKQYCDEKVEEIKCGRVKANTTHWQPRYDYNKSKSGERDWRDRRKEDQKSGFQDKRRGSHKGFGSSGRGGGRGGGRGSARGGARDGGRGGRDNRDKFDKRDKSDKRGNGRDEHQVPKIATTSAAADNPPSTSDLSKSAQVPPQTTELNSSGPISTTATETSTKKRPREAEVGDDSQITTKRVDVKAGEGDS